jgi:hypothetical protein
MMMRRTVISELWLNEIRRHDFALGTDGAMHTCCDDLCVLVHRWLVRIHISAGGDPAVVETRL